VRKGYKCTVCTLTFARSGQMKTKHTDMFNLHSFHLHIYYMYCSSVHVSVGVEYEYTLKRIPVRMCNDVMGKN
jgi:hypothetical protein